MQIPFVLAVLPAGDLAGFAYDEDAGESRVDRNTSTGKR